MIITEEIFQQGKSSNNGWNNKQLKILGLEQLVKGWRRALVGKDYPEETIQMFLAFKDAHFKNPTAIKKRNSTDFVDYPENIAYKDQYKHPNWQRMRLKVLKRDGFKCSNCNSLNKTLHAHHIKYIKGKMIWEVPIWYIVTLCEDCHSEEHQRDLRIK